jgi:hypothetical protein
MFIPKIVSVDIDQRTLAQVDEERKRIEKKLMLLEEKYDTKNRATLPETK